MGYGCKPTCNWINTLSCFKGASLKINEYLLVFGASGNTGTLAVQIGKRIGAKIIAVSKDDWIRDFGVDYISL